MIRTVWLFAIFSLFSSVSLGLQFKTCADELRVRYAARAMLSSVIMPSSLLAIYAPLIVNYTENVAKQRKYAKLLRAATDVFNGGTNNLIDQQWSAIVRRAQNNKWQRTQIKPSQTFKEISFSIDDFITTLHLLNTRPELRQECLNAQDGYWDHHRNRALPLTLKSVFTDEYSYQSYRTSLQNIMKRASL